ncbi:MAG: ATP-binding protein [Anaerolineae bacterium]|nr:ATP-binding protein [Anaerolineae bacterium]
MPNKKQTVFILKNIRMLLTNGFGDVELRRLCFDEPTFRPVYDQLNVNTGKDEVIQRLMEYAEQKVLLNSLLSLIEDRNPAQYAQYHPYIEGMPNPLAARNLNNPFHYGSPVPPEKFIGHRHAVEFCQATLTGPVPANITISGERRVGKTSLLHYLHRYAPEPEWGGHLIFRLDLGILSGMLTATTFWQQILRIFNSYLPPKSPLWSHVFDVCGQTTISGNDFFQVLQSYHQLNDSRPIIVMLDEFELMFQAYDHHIETLLTNLHAITLEPSNRITLITATRNTLPEVCRPYSRSTGNDFHSNYVACPLVPFDRAETERVVHDILDGTGLTFSTQELDFIWNLSQWQTNGAHPILLQVAGSLLFTYKQKNQAPIDFQKLTQEFKTLTRIYIGDLSGPLLSEPPLRHPRDYWVDYEQTLTIFENHILLEAPPERIQTFFDLADALRTHFKTAGENQTDQTLHSEPQTIIDKLTRLSPELTGLDFEQLVARYWRDDDAG